MEQLLYTTLGGEGRSELTEKKSVFLGYAAPARTEAEAEAFVKRVRAEHPDARHVVWALRQKDGVVARYSDDGEPQGSGGVPMLEVLRKAGVNDAVVAVVRYFGGILLGVGGLSRAYGGAAKGAIDDAGIVTYEAYAVYRFACSYGDYEKYRAEFPKFGVIVDDTAFSDRVTLTFAVKETEAERLLSLVREVSNGVDLPERLGSRFDKG